MHPFGDPAFPKKNITGGSLIMLVAAFEFGTLAQRTIQSGGVRVDYVLLVLVVFLFFIGIKTFRLGLAFVQPDPGNQRRQRTTMGWIGLVLFWIVLIVTPIAIIQFFARR